MPQPIDYDRLAADYARNRRVHPGVIGDLLATGGIDESSHILDVGCGTGNYIVGLDAALRCDCWGIDPSEQMLARAREAGKHVRFQLGRAEELAFEAGAFDLVFSVDVIHHVQDRAEYFRRAFRALKPGGRICTVTDSAWIIRSRRPLSAYFPESAQVDLARYPRMEELTAMMHRAGFRQIEEHMVEFAYDLDDIEPYRAKAFSSLHLISPEAYERGLARLEDDLQRGPIPCVSRYVLLWGRAHTA